MHRLRPRFIANDISAMVFVRSGST